MPYFRLKIYVIKNTQNEKINNVFNNNDNKAKELLLKKYLQKWQEKNDIITNKENVSDTILPNAFRLHKAKTFTKNNFVNKIMTIKYGAKYVLDNLKN